jgi:hypothetical protein
MARMGQCKNKTEARALDWRYGVYSELDEKTNMYCVFGAQSGFAYHGFSDPETAEIEATAMNEQWKEWRARNKPDVCAECGESWPCIVASGQMECTSIERSGHAAGKAWLESQ